MTKITKTKNSKFKKMRFKKIIKFSVIYLAKGNNTGNLMKNMSQTKKSLRKLVKNSRVKWGQSFCGVQTVYRGELAISTKIAIRQWRKSSSNQDADQSI